MRVREMINKKNQENSKSLFAIRSDSEILADPEVTSLLNFIVPDIDPTSMTHAIPILDELINVEPVQVKSTNQTQNSASNASITSSANQSSDLSLGLPDPIDTQPGPSQPRNKNTIQQDSELVQESSGQNSTQKSEQAKNPINENNSKKSDTGKTSTQSSVPINIEKDMDQQGIAVKRIWAKKLASSNESFFNGGTKSLQNLKDPFKWLNHYVMTVGEKGKTFRNLLTDDTLFCNPGLSDRRLAKYYDYINNHHVTTQSVVIGFETFIRNLLKTICKPETFTLLSRNLGQLPFNQNMRQQVGIFIDELIKACEPKLDGKITSISGRKIEELVREHWYRILDNDLGAERIEVKFRRSTIGYDLILKQLLKYNQFAWSNVMGMRVNPSGDFDAISRAEYDEALLLLRNLITSELVKPGKLSAMFAADMATDWKIDDKGVICSIETWNPNRLNKLSKPTTVDNILRHLKSELR